MQMMFFISKHARYSESPNNSWKTYDHKHDSKLKFIQGGFKSNLSQRIISNVVNNMNTVLLSVIGYWLGS